MVTSTPLTAFEFCESPPGTPVSALAPATGWRAFDVPGGIHEALLAHGLIEHPFRPGGEAAVSWIEERDWLVRATFVVAAGSPARARRLRLDGIDTVADVLVDGRPVAHHQNMFRPLEVDVSDLAAGDHELLVRLSPPMLGRMPTASATDLVEHMRGTIMSYAPGLSDEDAGVFAEALISPVLQRASGVRKMQCAWGWDFGPRVPSVGLHGAVTLVDLDPVELISSHVRTDALHIDEASSATTAELTITVEVEVVEPGAHEVSGTVLLAGIEVERFTRALDPTASGVVTLEVPVVLDDAQPWWPHDMGTPVLYDLDVEVRAQGTGPRRHRSRFGVRTIGIDRSEDREHGGRLFRFVVNGAPLFARGASWVPSTLLVASADDAHVRRLLGRAREANMNMVRVWGGGIYESDAFYAACDELGLLVWQDFMFACVAYDSDDPAFAAEVAAEVEHQVRRLRTHPSLALWCGGNEVHAFHAMAFGDTSPGNWGYGFFHELMPDLVARWDPTTPYWPGSPWSDLDGSSSVNSALAGDRHTWEVWHGLSWDGPSRTFDSPGRSRHYSRYADDEARFVSEFGVQASPSVQTLATWLGEDDLRLGSPAFVHRIQDHPTDKHDAVLEIVTGLPRTLDEYVDFTMASQAIALKFGIEHYRRREPQCSGTLIWQLNDVWPGISWSVLDFEARGKAGYYAAKRAFAPVVASFVASGDVLEAWISNSTATSRDIDAEVTIADYSGRMVRQEKTTVQVPAGTSRLAWRGDISEVEDPARFAWISSTSGCFPDNQYSAHELKDRTLPAPVVEWHVEPIDERSCQVHLHARAHATLLRIESSVAEVGFDDNFIDMRAGERRTIVVRDLPPDFTSDVITVREYAGTPGTVTRTTA